MKQTEAFHLLSFEGPDSYARAGGIASRVTGLSQALSEAGLETHLWFVGDPEMPGREENGSLILHRWCQWISRHHPGGVYEGEEGKCDDYARSLPPFLMHSELLPRLAAGGRATVLAEEWHTANAVLHLDWLLRQAGLRHRVNLLWNANNTFGFDRIDWQRLNSAATIVTVSRYMKHRMSEYHVDPMVIPNGLGAADFILPEEAAVSELRRRFAKRVLLTKVARWDPDKRWLLAVDTVAELKRHGHHPLLVARGGLEAHESEVLGRARQLGLNIVERSISAPGPQALLIALDAVNGADMVVLRSHLDPTARGVLLRGADAVLANSGHEPFGLVALETMAVGGLACTGVSGEDYAVDGQNAIVLQTSNPQEFVTLFTRLNAARNHALRKSAMATAEEYAWSRVVERSLLPRISA